MPPEWGLFRHKPRLCAYSIVGFRELVSMDRVLLAFSKPPTPRPTEPFAMHRHRLFLEAEYYRLPLPPVTLPPFSMITVSLAPKTAAQFPKSPQTLEEMYRKALETAQMLARPAVMERVFAVIRN